MNTALRDWRFWFAALAILTVIGLLDRPERVLPMRMAADLDSHTNPASSTVRPLTLPEEPSAFASPGVRPSAMLSDEAAAPAELPAQWGRPVPIPEELPPR